MKTACKQIAGILLILFVAFGDFNLYAQDNYNYISVSGVVKDKRTKKKLENVSISVPHTSVGTITNADGEFTLKINDSIKAKYVEISSLGYASYKLPIGNQRTQDEVILLTSNTNLLSEVVVQGGDPFKLVQEAILRIGSNYCPETNLLSGFYRETIKKGRNYINISEAVIDIYKTDYKHDMYKDRLQVSKGRKLLSPKVSDTLLVKFQGGPNLSIYLDLVKNPDVLFNEETLDFYKFKMEDPVMIDERPHFVISFEPQVIAPVALYYGKLYIDQSNMAFSRIEFNLSMDDQQKATQAILRKKPFKLRFKPEEVSFLVTYKQRDGISYLNYIKSEIRFKCDWKRKLFSTNYTILAEMVVTGGKNHNVDNIPYKQSFKEDQVLSDNLSNFADVNFWEDYNIIEPTESLESAVNKLKKQYK